MTHELARAGLVWLLRRRIRRLWRRLAILLGLRRITPRDGEPRPFVTIVVPELGRDTGGAYRPSHRPQDPSRDPDEPYGGESSSRGTDHGWSNCTMASGADVLAYHTRGELLPWGGKLRHKQGDLEGGTDLYDLRDAWAAMGETLTIRSGAGWGAVVDAHEEGRAVVIQGEGEVPGAGSFAGGHACAIGIETRSSDGAWLFGDPLVTDWQWIAPGKIRSWAEAWSSSVAFAVSRVVSSPPPEPEPPKPAPAAAPCYSLEELVEVAVDAALVAAGDAAVELWVDWLREPAPLPADRWDAGSWSDPASTLDALIAGLDVDPCAPGAPASWSRGPLPDPVDDALRVIAEPAVWGASGWRAAGWMPPDAAMRRSR